MNSSVTIYHHLGLGDHIVCNGLVRYYCSLYERVTIFCKPHNQGTVVQMFKDLNNLDIILGDDSVATGYISSVKNAIKIGFENLNPYSEENFDIQFYKQISLDPKDRYKLFKYDRDIETELSIRKTFPEKYIFVHDDESRGFGIKHNSEIPIVKPTKGLTGNIFNFLKTIEDAEEIHCIDSSFKCMIDSLPQIFEEKKLYFHKYARQLNNNFYIPSSTLKWNVINA